VEGLAAVVLGVQQARHALRLFPAGGGEGRVCPAAVHAHAFGQAVPHQDQFHVDRLRASERARVWRRGGIAWGADNGNALPNGRQENTMSTAFAAYPELRNPFPATPIHPAGSTTVLYQGKTVVLSDTGSGDHLLIRPEDLTRVNGFALKPEGICLDDICIPMQPNLLVEQGGRQWFDLTAFADLMGQAHVADVDARVWSFAEMPATRDNTLLNALAPALEVVDRKGEVIRLADYRGRKVLIVTWSSW
jgi:hypothetical protein